MSECGQTPPRQFTVWSLCPKAGAALCLYTVRRRRGSTPSGARPGRRAGPGRGCGLPHRSGQLPQEASRAQPNPSLGAALEGCPPHSAHPDRCQRVLGDQMQR